MDTSLPVDDRIGLPSRHLNALKKIFKRFSSTADVLQWGLLQQPPWEFVDIIHQDEYCIDLIMMLPDGFYLVFDTT